MDLSWRKQRLSITRNVKIARESSSQTTSLRRHIVSPGIKNVCCICSLTRSENLMAPYRNMTVSARSMLLNMLKYSDWPLRKLVRIYGRHWRVLRGRKWFFIALKRMPAMKKAMNLFPGLSNVRTVHPEGFWICPYISRHLLSLNPLLACCRRYSRGER